MLDLILYIITFIFVYLVYIIFVIKRKKGIERLPNSTEIRFLTQKFNLDKNKINIKEMGYVIGLANAFIITTTITIVLTLDNFVLMLIVGFLILIPLIFIIYIIIGKYYQKKLNKNGKK